MDLVGQIVIKRAKSRDFPRSGCGVQPVIRRGTILMLDAVAAEIRHVAINIRNCYRFNKVEIHIQNGDFVQPFVLQ